MIILQKKRSGRKELQVIEELGIHGQIAKNIITSKQTGKYGETYDSYELEREKPDV